MLMLTVLQMAVAIVAAMLFVVIDPVYDFLGEYVVWIVITVGETYPSFPMHARSKDCTLHAHNFPRAGGAQFPCRLRSCGVQP